MSASSAAALAATGPRFEEGKAISARNSLTHGLTSKSTLLPSEDAQEFADFQAALNQRYGPDSLEDRNHIAEFADLTWRLQRIPVHEAKLIAVELKRMQIGTKSDKPSRNVSTDSTNNASKPSPSSACCNPRL